MARKRISIEVCFSESITRAYEHLSLCLESEEGDSRHVYPDNEDRILKTIPEEGKLYYALYGMLREEIASSPTNPFMELPEDGYTGSLDVTAGLKYTLNLDLTPNGHLQISLYP